jgi:hypothetical protein
VNESESIKNTGNNTKAPAIGCLNKDKYSIRKMFGCKEKKEFLVVGELYFFHLLFYR